MDDIARRIRASGDALLELRAPLVAGEPWPLSADYGHTAESDWGPREVLGHVDEMLPYWVDELETVLTADPSTPARFGRVATDQSRLDRIAADRQKPVGDLLDDIAIGLDRAVAFVDRLTPADRARVGVHPSRGEISVGDSLAAFLSGHLEGHVTQLREILTRHPA